MRRCKNGWISAYLELTARMESPTAFHYWTALWTLSSVAERKVWLPFGFSAIYPNLYVILVAKSAICRKSAAVNVGRELLNKMDPPVHIISQKITPEALIKSISGHVIPVNETEIKRMALGTIFVPELSMFLGTESYRTGLVALLTDLYDCPDRTVYETRMHGVEVMQNVYITFLGASTPEWLRTAMPAQTVTGGFIERFSIVYQETPREPNPFPIMTQEELALFDDVVADLAHIRKDLKGAYTLTKEAKEWYEGWYSFQIGKRKEGVPGGYWGRRHTLLLKLGILEAMASYDEPVITKEVLEGALKVMELTEFDMPKVIATLGSSTEGFDVLRVLDIIKEALEIKRSKLQRRVQHFANARTLDQILATLEASGLVIAEMHGTAAVYRYIGDEEAWLNR